MQRCTGCSTFRPSRANDRRYHGRVRSAFWLVLALAPACVKDSLVPCGDLLCPSGFTCDAEAHVCVDPDGLSLPNQIAIGDTACGGQTTQQLVVKNLGGTTFVYSAVSDVAGVVVIPAHGTFEADSMTTLELRATVSMDSLPGREISGSLLFDLGTAAVLRRPISMTPIGALLDVSVQTLSFGEAAVGDMTTKNVVITNRGTLDVTVMTTLAQAPADGSFLPPAPSVHVAAGGTSSVPITFFPHSLVAYSSVLQLAPDVPLCQAPLASVDLEGAATNQAILVDSLVLDYGNVACGGPAGSLPLTITNKGTTAQALSFGVTGTDAALFDPVADQAVAGNDKLTIPIGRRVVRNPQGVIGMRTAALEITATGVTTTMKSIDLRANVQGALLQVQEGCVSIGTVAAHGQASADITLVNTGNATALITAATFPDVSMSPSSVQVPAGSSAPVTITVGNTSNFSRDVSGNPVVILDGGDTTCSAPITVTACGGV